MSTLIVQNSPQQMLPMVVEAKEALNFKTKGKSKA
jgi:hypothetical protein